MPKSHKVKSRRTSSVTSNQIFFILLLALSALVVFLFINRNPGPTDNANLEGQTTSVTGSRADGLIIEDLSVGTGAEARAGNTVVVHYTGWLEDGTVFDSSLNRNQPFEFQIGAGRVITGWEQGIPGMSVGGIRALTIPPELAYGSQQRGSIPANSTLYFEVELLEIK
jgi:FKBP-type peptidyl-prolyl cis-trans isomerase FkpA